MNVMPSPDYFRNNVALRNDTLLGVCESLGHDLGIHPNLLRVPLAAGIIFQPLLMVGIYLALGALVFVSRTFFPDRMSRLAPAAAVKVPVVERAVNDRHELNRAA